MKKIYNADVFWSHGDISLVEEVTIVVTSPESDRELRDAVSGKNSNYTYVLDDGRVIEGNQIIRIKQIILSLWGNIKKEFTIDQQTISLPSKSKAIALMYLSRARTELLRKLSSSEGVELSNIKYDIACLTDAIRELEKY